jgi:cyclophilin family peptidyl-prolyl cis-trans isomerase
MTKSFTRSVTVTTIALAASLAALAASPQQSHKQSVCVLQTNVGTMAFQFFEAEAPQTAKQFQKLVRDGFYNGKEFYRVVKGHVIQAGGGAAPKLPPEFNGHPHLVGTVGLGRDQDINSGDSEFYICIAPRPHLDGKYTVFGQLIEGYDVLEKISNVEVDEKWEGEDKKLAMHKPKKPVIIEKAWIEERDLSPKAPTVKALGKYDFWHYYDYDELTSFLRDMAKAHPNLAELRSLCKSPMGRDVWMMVINNRKTGTDTEKPAFFLNQIHAGEVIASMSCNYTIWWLLDKYGKDPEATRVVDGVAWYIVPRLDVDGAEAYLTGKPAGVDPDPVDDDKDGKFDEDPQEDLDNDGRILSMRRKDPKGTMKISDRDSRLMVAKAPDETGGVYYTITSEGIDNDGDGKINEDGYRTQFLSNRNYPGNWKPQTIQGGSGAYPMEERTTRAEVDFVASHPNIAVYVQHHCCGQVILRPPATKADGDFANKEDLEIYRIVSARALEKTGWGLATSIYDWRFPFGTPDRKSTQIYRDKEGKIRNAPAGMYPESETGSDFDGTFRADDCPSCDRGYYAWGSSVETTYDLFGIFSLGDEHWESPDYDQDGDVSQEERLRWNDWEMGGRLFVNWHPFKHPTLGDVEIGGWVRTRNSPPEGELVEKECERGNAFVIYLAGITPKVKFGKADVKDKKDRVYQVELVVENQGLIPTATQQAEALGLGEPLLLEVSPDDNLEILFGETSAKLPRILGHSESEKISYLVRVKSASKKAVLKVSVKSQKAGQDLKEIEIK